MVLSTSQRFYSTLNLWLWSHVPLRVVLDSFYIMVGVKSQRFEMGWRLIWIRFDSPTIHTRMKPETIFNCLASFWASLKSIGSLCTYWNVLARGVRYNNVQYRTIGLAADLQSTVSHANIRNSPDHVICVQRMVRRCQSHNIIHDSLGNWIFHCYAYLADIFLQEKHDHEHTDTNAHHSQTCIFLERETPACYVPKYFHSK